MGKKISIDPDRLEGLANQFVLELSAIETEYKDLHKDLYYLISNAPAEYKHCFYHVGDPWSTGDDLVDYLSEAEQGIRSTANKFAEKDNLIAQLYNLHDKYGTFTAMGALVGRQLTYYGLGFTQFFENKDGAYSFKHNKALTKLSDTVDSSRLRKPARSFLSPKYLGKKYKNATFADLVHKKYAKYLPGEVAKFTTNTQRLTRSFKNGTVNATKFKNFVSTAYKFGKANAAATFGITFATETFGAGLKISENYAKYGDMPEVLKRENAKAVGNAVNKTVAVSVGSIGGAVIGGAIGSTFGPVGTVVGGAIGAAAGGFIGDKVAKLTAGLAEKATIALKDPIHKGVNFFKSGFEKTGKVVDGFNKGVDFVNDQIKDTLSDPVGKVKEISKDFSKAKETASSLVNGAKGFLEDKFSFI